MQDNINAVNFTPNSKMGKMLMAKCKTLQEENEEIGNQASEGKVKIYFLASISGLIFNINIEFEKKKDNFS